MQLKTDVDGLGGAARTFAKIGLLSFGGPAAQIAVMHRVLVDEKRWLSEKQFLHALNFCMLLPGPEAMQLATYAGWLLHGVRGGLLAGLLFIVPGLVMMLAVAWAYVALGDVPLVSGIFYGLKAAVIAVVAQALVRLAGRALGSRVLWMIAVLAFVAIFVFRLPFPLIIALAGCAGYMTWCFAPHVIGVPAALEVDEPLVPDAGFKPALAQSVRVVAIWGGLWLGALLVLAVGAGDGFLTRAALFFSQTAVVTFGGAYAVLAYVGQQAVESYGWLTAADMMVGLGLAETTLGPLVLVLVFVGFVGGANAAPAMALSGGLAGGLVAAFFTFVPCFLWIFAGAPHMERLRRVRWLTASLSAVTAAVVGVIANLAAWFTLQVLYGPFDVVQSGAVSLPVPSWTEPDWLALAIAVAACVALLRLKASLFVVIGLASLAGVALGPSV